MFDPSVVKLVAITDGLHGSEAALVRRCRDAAEGGATCIQLRLKESSPREVAEIARAIIRETGIPLIINDRADIAIAVGAAGCHVGAGDVPATAIRKMVPASFIVGCSVGSDAELGGAEGADYAGIGPVFSTSTKADAGRAIGLDGFRALAAKLSIPCIGIGGISAENAGSVLAAGASGVAVVSSIFSARDVKSAAMSLARAIER